MFPVIRSPQDVDVLAVLEFEFLVSVPRLLLCIPEVSSPMTKAMDKTWTPATTWRAGMRDLTVKFQAGSVEPMTP
jgi:hypothetical protein